MYYSMIGLLAVLLLFIVNQDILHNPRVSYEKPAWNVYRKFLFAVLAYYITDILWGILESQKMVRLLFADTTIYFVAMAVGVLFWAEFTVTYLEEDRPYGRFLVISGRIISGLIALLSIINIFIPVLFSIDSDCVYHALPTRYVMLTFQIILLILISVYAYVTMFRLDARDRKRQRYRILASFGLIMAFFLIIQLWLPYLPLYSIAYMLGTCMLHTFVANDDKEEYKRGLEEAEKVKELTKTVTSLLNNMPGMTFTKDAQTGIYLACNQAFADYANKPSPEYVVGLTDEEIFDPVTAKHFTDDDHMALSMDKAYVFFEDVLDPLGNQKHFRTTKLKYIDASGKLCLLGMCEDITDMIRMKLENATTKEAYENARNSSLIYTRIAQTLARGYTDLYYVNLDNEEFIEYLTSDDSGLLSEARRGTDFFEELKIEAQQFVHADDRDSFIKTMDRDNLLNALSRNKTFIMTYRIINDNEPMYVMMKVSRMDEEDNFIIIGVTDVDEQTKHQKAAERMEEEHTAYARLNALIGDFLCVYVVVPETGRYREYSSSSGFAQFDLPKEGFDFYKETLENCKTAVYKEDLERFLSLFSKEGILSEIERNGIFSMTYRLVMDQKPVYVQLRAAMVHEKEGLRLIVGINDIDTQVRQEEEYTRRLEQAQTQASIDALTRVKNRHAYLDAEEKLDQRISDGEKPEFSIVILDVNDLKMINDTRGHQAGDQYLVDSAQIICKIFKHSPVFRIGGDEFAVISQGSDYENIDELLNQVYENNRQAAENGGIVIACGMARYNSEDSVAPVFELADQRMYENKMSLKADRS